MAAKKEKETVAASPAGEIQSCQSCGVAFDITRVQPRPFKSCPVCKAPLDQDAVAHTFVESGNVSDPKDAQRTAARAQHATDVDAHASEGGYDDRTLEARTLDA